MADFPRLRKLHRQRTRRRHDVEVLGGHELAQRLGVEVDQLIVYLTRQNWPFHIDSSLTAWMTLRKHTCTPVFESAAQGCLPPGSSE
ncbi:MAG: hypothetical protein O3A63_14965 [Proteobacteria bacterium]|nr:hypothetical protein [Pseudomonadota bacterium]